MDGSAPVDTSSEEHLLDCLARHICNLPIKERRHAFLALMRKKHPSEFIDDIERRVRIQWPLRQKS
jgi:hypothetical protein